jgi:hypothetical protein
MMSESPGRPSWVAPLVAGAVGLLVGTAMGYWLLRPEEPPRVVTRTIEVSPRSCAEAVESASAIVELVGRVPPLVLDASTAIRNLDLVRLQALGQEVLELAEMIREEAARAAVAALDCRSKVRSG